MAKRLLPFTLQQTQSLPTQLTEQVKKTQFQPRVASSMSNLKNNSILVNTVNVAKQIVTSNVQKSTNNSVDLKLLIEKKRQEALMKLRRRQPQNK